MASASTAVATRPLLSLRACKTCGVEQVESEFYLRSDGKLDLHCKDCVRARERRIGAKSRRAAGMSERWRPEIVAIDDCGSFVQCSECKKWRPLDGFYASSSNPLGIQTGCKDCRKARSKATQKTRPISNERRVANRDRLRNLFLEEPERIAAYKNDRRARLLDAPVRDLTAGQWRAILAAYACCAYCDADGKLTQDHLVPLTRGGSHTASNIVPACKSCNSRKRTRTPAEWLAAGGNAVDLAPHPFIAPEEG